ncbi:MAG: ribonuclease H-like domain-containing protein [Bacteroidota bacterium]
MIQDVSLEDILFLDIETVPQYATYKEVPDTMKQLWERKASYLMKPGDTAPALYKRAGIYAEFGKIVCISVGAFLQKEDGWHLRLKSFFSEEEKILLQEFSEALGQLTQRKPLLKLCAHNGKEFDFPYIARRMLVNQLRVPQKLNVAGKKPWEVDFLDTMELWRFGDYKHYTSLNLLAYIFDIPTPKDDIDGSMVGSVFHDEHNLKRIVTYCEKDVLTIGQLFLRYRGEALLSTSAVSSSTTFEPLI